MMRKFKTPIRHKLLAASLIVTTAVVSVITFTMANLFHQDKKTYIHDLTSTMVIHNTSEIKALLKGYKNRLEFFARILVDEKLEEFTQQRLLQEIFVDFQDLIAITLVRKNKKDLTLYDPSMLNTAGINKSDYTSYRLSKPIPEQQLKQHGVYIENSTIHKNLPSFTLVFGIDATTVVSAIIRLDSIMEIAQRSTLFQTYILHSDNTLFSHLDPVLTRDPEELISSELLGDVRNPHSLGITKEYHHNGVDVIGGFANVGVGNLLVVSQIPKTAAFLSARSLLENLIYVALGLLLVTVLISLVWAFRLTRPLELLSKATKVVGAGHFDIKLNIHSSDEIGDLAHSFDEMAQGLKLREEKLEQAKNALIQSEKMSAFGQLSAGIAHEVKNPLTGILGYAQLAKRKLDENSPLMKNLEVIERETKRCKAIIENLMKFARSDASERRPVLMDLNNAIQHAVEIVDHQLNLNGVSIQLKLQSQLPQILGDTNQLEQVVMNLLINAQHAMEGAAGTVTISSRMTEQNTVEILVTDNGPGMSAEVQAKIFEPFFTTKKSGEGTGLGLSVSYGIIQDHSGKIRVQSVLNQGTVFVITLPIPSSSDISQRTGTDPL
ncbi:MAG: ATP-binding protein [Gammaproteobacteria bacterium]|nr:ATP-binding protein [Gammaproteobacteria bacterium]MDH5800112.1 ATP-binding protein [Gammaproteobacteria bacterium]